ncbi:helix-turn-helix domain-containing protein [Streptomyces sp. NPDC058572]|uniref:helix-turn-helix domain-containing protein n=1 Tax=Streptomyces sp. NPDC058572 TaxID=3346546 RepID=UPI0036676833
MEALYGFDTAKLRAARTTAGVSAVRIARAAGVTTRAVRLYLAGSRVPRPEILPRLAEAVGVAPEGLCTVERERLVHLRVWTGRSRSAMAAALGMAAETYRQLETTGRRGRLSASRYDRAQDRWILWQDWASPTYCVGPQRLLVAGLKEWRGLATRYDKTPESYAAGLHLRGSILWLTQSASPPVISTQNRP